MIRVPGLGLWGFESWVKGFGLLHSDLLNAGERAPVHRDRAAWLQHVSGLREIGKRSDLTGISGGREAPETETSGSKVPAWFVCIER